MGMEHFTSQAPIALHVDDMAQARARLTDAGVEFQGEPFDTGVCFMSFFTDPNGNALMLHHRYAARTPQSWAAVHSSPAGWDAGAMGVMQVCVAWGALSRHTPLGEPAAWRQGAPTRVSISAPHRAPIAAASAIDPPLASPNVTPAANESPHP